MRRTSWQNRRLHKLLSEKGIDEELKRILAKDFSGGRTDKTSEMSYDEMHNLIHALESDGDLKKRIESKRRDILRKQIISLLYSLPDEFGFYKDYSGMKKFDGKRFDDFLEKDKHSPMPGRKFNDLDMKELSRLMAVMKKWVEFYNNKKNRKDDGKDSIGRVANDKDKRRE